MDPQVSTVEAFCRELGLELYVGPPRPVSAEVAAALGLSETCSIEEVLSAINSLMGERLIEAGTKSPDVAAMLESQTKAIIEFQRGELRETEKKVQAVEELALVAKKRAESSKVEREALSAILQVLKSLSARLTRIESAVGKARDDDSLPGK